MFWWSFESENDPNTDPLVLWLTGGPGCSSELAVFLENGPYKMDMEKQLHYNPYTWSKVANMVYIDNPIGTGFSVAERPSDMDKMEDAVAADFHTFMLGYLAQHPEFEGRDFYITGESYAGHYIPAIAHMLVTFGKDIPVNFKGIAIGNGWVDPVSQYPKYLDYAKAHNFKGLTTEVEA